jgi:hypothetical protein
MITERPRAPRAWTPLAAVTERIDLTEHRFFEQREEADIRRHGHCLTRRDPILLARGDSRGAVEPAEPLAAQREERVDHPREA